MKVGQYFKDTCAWYRIEKISSTDTVLRNCKHGNTFNYSTDLLEDYAFLSAEKYISDMLLQKMKEAL